MVLSLKNVLNKFFFYIFKKNNRLKNKIVWKKGIKKMKNMFY